MVACVCVRAFSTVPQENGSSLPPPRFSMPLLLGGVVACMAFACAPSTSISTGALSAYARPLPASREMLAARHTHPRLKEDSEAGELRTIWDLIMHGQKGKRKAPSVEPPPPPAPPQSNYVPPEQWSESNTEAELRWEAKVQREAQRNGNSVRQNEILRDELGKQ